MTVVGEEFNFIKPEAIEDLLTNHTRGVNPRRVIFPISATQALNSQIASAFRTSLQKKLWHFLIGDGDAENFLIKTNKEFTNNIDDSETFSFYLNPYVQTGLLIGECINLDMSISNGLIRLSEKPGCFKDRYSAVSYANWVISQLDQELLKDNSNNDDFDYVASLIQTT